MNERIRELAEQAGYNGHYATEDFDVEYFSELIVKECEKRLREEGNLAKIQAFTGSIYKFTYMNEAANIVKQHFGIDE